MESEMWPAVLMDIERRRVALIRKLFGDVEIEFGGPSNRAGEDLMDELYEYRDTCRQVDMLTACFVGRDEDISAPREIAQ